jgi:hypothetical protein
MGIIKDRKVHILELLQRSALAGKKDVAVFWI